MHSFSFSDRLWDILDLQRSYSDAPFNRNNGDGIPITSTSRLLLSSTVSAKTACVQRPLDTDRKSCNQHKDAATRSPTEVPFFMLPAVVKSSKSATQLLRNYDRNAESRSSCNAAIIQTRYKTPYHRWRRSGSPTLRRIGWDSEDYEMPCRSR